MNEEKRTKNTIWHKVSLAIGITKVGAGGYNLDFQKD